MIISIACQKGGVGKTTTTTTLSAGLSLKGKKTLIIDIDPQANSSKIFIPNYQKLKKEDTVYTTIIDEKNLPIHSTYLPNMFIVPSHIFVSETDLKLAGELYNREGRLKKALDKVKNDFDYILIDCPPALSYLTLNAFTASNSVIVCISPGYFELDSIVHILQTLSNVKNHFNSNLELSGILYTMSDNTIDSKENLKLLRQTFTQDVFKTIIPRNVDIKESQRAKKDIFTYNPKSKAAENYNYLISEIFKI